MIHRFFKRNTPITNGLVWGRISMVDEVGSRLGSISRCLNIYDELTHFNSFDCWLRAI